MENLKFNSAIEYLKIVRAMNNFYEDTKPYANPNKFKYNELEVLL